MLQKNQLLMQQFIPILTMFIKYLNPQILADHIAKEFEKTKKHRNIIFALKNTLQFLNFARGIGYRIAIIGRINSSKKSRTIYLKRKTLIRQNFNKNLNFATAQARARIGSFGIKV
jgi:ribosomal protein S3